MVSAVRFRRAHDCLSVARPYTEGIDGIVKRVTSASDGTLHPFLVVRDRRSIGICVAGSDRGLCGAFNINVIREAEQLALKLSDEARSAGPKSRGNGAIEIYFLPVGRKVFRHFRRKAGEPLYSVPELGASVTSSLANDLANQLIRLYLEGKLDEIWLVFTHFISSGSRRVATRRLLPLKLEQSAGVAKGYGYLYEPRAQELLQLLLPRYVSTGVFMALSESSASEHSARMVAMSFATRNADDMVDDLTLSANRARQSSITKEIADIVGTAEVLR